MIHYYIFQVRNQAQASQHTVSQRELNLGGGFKYATENTLSNVKKKLKKLKITQKDTIVDM